MSQGSKAETAARVTASLLGCAGADVPMWRRAWRDKILPAVVRFNPDLVLVSAGFDAHRKDDMNFRYIGIQERDFEWLTDQIVQARPMWRARGSAESPIGVKKTRLRRIGIRERDFTWSTTQIVQLRLQCAALLLRGRAQHAADAQ